MIEQFIDGTLLDGSNLTIDDRDPRAVSAWLAHMSVTSARMTTFMGLVRRCSAEDNDDAADVARTLADYEILSALRWLDYVREKDPDRHPEWKELMQRAEEDVAKARSIYEEGVAISAIGRPEVVAPYEVLDIWHTPRLWIIAMVRGMQVLAQSATSLHEPVPDSVIRLAYADAVHIGNEMVEIEKNTIVRNTNEGRNRTPRPKGANRRLNQQAEVATIDQATAVTSVKAIRRPHLEHMVMQMLRELDPSMESLNRLYHHFQSTPMDILTHSEPVKNPRTGKNTTAPIVLMEHGDFVWAKLAHEHFPKRYREGEAFVHIQGLRMQGASIVQTATDQRTRRYGQQMVDAADYLMRTLECGIHDVQLHEIREFVTEALDRSFSLSSVKRCILPSIAGEDHQLAKDIGVHIDVNRLGRMHRGSGHDPNAEDRKHLIDRAHRLKLPDRCMGRLVEFLEVSRS